MQKISPDKFFIFAKATNISIFKQTFGRHCFRLQTVPAWNTPAERLAANHPSANYTLLESFMKSISILLSLLFFELASGQISRLNLSISSADAEADSVCFRLCVTQEGDTISDKIIYSEFNNRFDSLTPGYYKIHLYNCTDPGELMISKNATLLEAQATNIHIDVSSFESYSRLDKKTGNEIVKQKTEIQLNASYVNTDWLEKNSKLNFGSNLDFTMYNWYCFSKHFGILSGFGFGMGHYGISADTTFMNLTNSKKLYEYYNYIKAHIDLKFRISFKSQQENKFLSPRVFLDIGAAYYAPIAFRHITRYEDNKKISNARLHQFTDLRAHVDFGYSPLIFFAEYRVIDFLIGNYPELPRYNFGLKLTLSGFD